MQTQFWATLVSVSEKNEIFTLFTPVIEFIRDEEELIPYVLYNEASGPRVVSTRGVLLREDELSLSTIFHVSELKNRYKDVVIAAFDLNDESIIETPLEVYVQCTGISLPEVSLEYRKNEKGVIETFTDFDNLQNTLDEINSWFDDNSISTMNY